MRDGNRLKEKIEILLDRRQVTSLAVVALLLAAGLFALGVMVGKTLASQPRAAAAQEALLDQLDAAVDAGPGGDRLTFQDELTRKLPKLPIAPLPKPATPKPAPVAAPMREAAAPARVAAAAVAVAVPDAGVVKPTSGIHALPDADDTDSGVEVAIATKLPPPPPPPPPPAKSFFTVQVKATQSQPEAEKYALKLRSEGYQPLVAEAEVPGKGHWYRVRVGRFDNRTQAERYLADFKRETHVEAFVTAAGH